ncbi:KOW motif-containing protein [uncultured Pseudoramibacter sp.]|uniref:KOW motif-containing protein n=1 Tax=uncultured Pseudoramibacter sp. TaxID=1623493 RepID=UPI0025D31835|nr:KOW motif-containing protein [uncultured Pseudoramibacter sp.]
MMTWAEFYDKYLEWSDSTVSSRLSQISDIRNADAAEIVDCCQCIEETLACRLLRKAAKAQITFSFAQVAELALFISDEELLNTIASRAAGPCTQAILEELNNNGIKDELITDIAKSFSLRDPNEGAIWQPGVLQQRLDDMADSAGKLADNLNRINKNLEKQKRQRKPGLLSFLEALGETKNFKSSSGFRVGDHVRVKYRGQEGTIVDINGGLIMVSLDDGGHVDSYDASQLEKAW